MAEILHCPKCDFTTGFGEQRLKTHMTKMHGRKKAAHNGVDDRYADAVKLFFPDGIQTENKRKLLEDLDLLDELWERVNA